MSYSTSGLGAMFDFAGGFPAGGRRCTEPPSRFASVPRGRSAGCLTARPSSEQERARTCYFMASDHGQPWLMLGVLSPQAGQLRDALHHLGFGVGPEEGGNTARRYGGLAGAVEQAWYRFGSQRAWWVYELTTNVGAGVTWDHGRYVRIHPDHWDRIMDAARGSKAPWDNNQSEPFVRVAGGSPAERRDNLIDRLAARLINAGLMPPTQVTGGVLRTDGQGFVGGDSGPFIRALQEAHVAAQADGADVRWPRGTNFGPTTRPFGSPSGPLNQLRVDANLLAYLHCNLLPGEVERLPRFIVTRINGGFPKVG